MTYPFYEISFTRLPIDLMGTYFAGSNPVERKCMDEVTSEIFLRFQEFDGIINYR